MGLDAGPGFFGRIRPAQTADSLLAPRSNKLMTQFIIQPVEEFYPDDDSFDYQAIPPEVKEKNGS